MSRVDPRHISESTYLELVRSLFGTLVPSMIMSALFVVTAWICVGGEGKALLTMLAILASAAAFLRHAILFALRMDAAKNGLDRALARRVEMEFGTAYLAFALLLGLFAAACLALCPVEEHIAIAALVVGYAAGVAAGISLRPWIGVPAMLLSVIPPLLVAIGLGDRPHLLLATLLAVLMSGGIGSMVGRYRAAVEMIEMRHLMASLARQDPLTGLANRLALADAFARSVESQSSHALVLHCLDLDRFKPVNDLHGHLVGDQLLKAVAERLERLVRQEDLAVRLGGDEFVILQAQVVHDDQAELMARRLVQTMAKPFVIEGHHIQVGASVGYARALDHGSSLQSLLGAADRALYDAKHHGRGACALAS
jgi:diguanylate cyclase (GGDEF)-like protein